MNKKKSNKNLIILLSILVISGGYLYFSNNIKSDGFIAKAQGSSLGVLGEGTANNGTLNSKINEDISFLSTLASLKKIRIDTTFFSSDIFKKLENNAVRIEPITPGRLNPFAPIDEAKIAQATLAPRVVTNQANGKIL